MLIGRDELCGLIPHGNGMCLLEQVTAWDTGRIECLTETHHHPDNPLRDDTGLPAVCALEYGAQAMAVHGGLLARTEGRTAPQGWLAAVRDAAFHTPRLDTLPGALKVSAVSKMAGAAGIVYDISVEVVMNEGSSPVAAGRLVVVAVG